MVETQGGAEGDHVIRVCRDASGDRATAVTDAARDATASVRVIEAGSTGATGLEPLATATLDGTTAFLANCTADRIRDAVAALESGSLPGDADATVEHEPDPATLPVPDLRPLNVGVRRALGRCGWVEPAAVDDYGDLVADRGPDDVFERIGHMGLLGRGRGDGSTDAPIAAEWETARETTGAGDPVVVVNAHEADDRVRADRLLLESAPIDVVDAAAAVARVVGATDVLVYCNEEHALAIERARGAAAAVEEHAERAGELSIRVATGPDRYIAGEPTMALEAMEGNDRLEARLRPPSPARHGLYGRPTVIHTPRTLAQVRRVLLDPDAFDPADADPGTRLVTVTGDVDAPATVELPTGGSLAEVRDATRMDGSFKMACVGGQFGGLVRSLDLPAGAPALAAADLGTDGAVELLNDGNCAVATAGTRTGFARDRNCGRCVPCREGSKQLLSLLRDVYSGSYDDDGIRELTRVMAETSTCEFGQTAPRPVVTAMSEFETEFEAHAEGRCPSGACEGGAT